jgi:hypothetical protein
MAVYTSSVYCPACCGGGPIDPCEGLPATVNVTFSGILRCNDIGSFPLPNGTYLLTFYDNNLWEFQDSNFVIELFCGLSGEFPILIRARTNSLAALGLFYAVVAEENVAYLSLHDLDNCQEGDSPYIGYGGIVSYEFVR